MSQRVIWTLIGIGSAALAVGARLLEQADVATLLLTVAAAALAKEYGVSSRELSK